MIRCWDTGIESSLTTACKIFDIVRKSRVPAEKCSYRSTQKANIFNAKTNRKGGYQLPQTGALITSADNSSPSPLPFHTALKITQPNIFTLYQHTHIGKHTHLQTHTNTHTYTHTHSSAKHILALLACLTITNKLIHIDKQTNKHTHTHGCRRR